MVKYCSVVSAPGPCPGQRVCCDTRYLYFKYNVNEFAFTDYKYGYCHRLQKYVQVIGWEVIPGFLEMRSLTKIQSKSSSYLRVVVS